MEHVELRTESMKTKTIISALALAVATSGPEFAQTRPTATEVFHPPTDCGALGDKRRAEAEAGKEKSSHIMSETHYDAVANRCYIRLSFSKQGFFNVFLFDAQTMQMLAMTLADGNRCDGLINVENKEIDVEDRNAGANRAFANWQKATTFMDRVMKPEVGKP